MQVTSNDNVKAGHSVLYLTPVPNTPPEVAHLEAAVGSSGNIKVLTNVDGSLSDNSSAYDVIISTAASASGHSGSFLSAALKSLKPGGTLLLREPLLLGLETVPSLRSESQLRSALTLAGFLDTQLTNTQEQSNSAVAQVDGKAIQVQVATFEITSRKPQWEVGAKATLSFGLKTAPAIKRQKQETKPSTAVWTLSSDDTVDESVAVVSSTKSCSVWKISGDDEDEELEDENALLGAEDLLRPGLSAKRDDCEIGKGGKKKACKNCTCGRAEGQMEVEDKKEAPKETPKSSCGSCYLGDAFRCSSCPYKGLPPFNPGDKVKITVD